MSNFDNGWWGNLWLNGGEKVRLSVNPDQSHDAFIPFEQKDWFTMKESDPALYKYTLESDKSYKIMNYSGEEVRIGTNSGYNFRFQVLKYDANSNYELWEDHYGDVILRDKEYFFASYVPQEQNKLVFYYPYDQFRNGVIIRESDSEYEDYFDILPKIKMNVSKILSKTDSEMETTKIDDTLRNYNLTIKNKTKDIQINDFFIKDNYIVFAKNSVAAFDEVNIKLESKNNDTESKEFNITLDKSSQGESNLSILEVGKIRVSENNPQKNIPMTRTLIFNEQGKVIETKSSNSGETIQSMPLQEGKYTVVLLKANGELWRMDQLSEFKDRGLVEGTDYLKYEIQVTNGKISTINPNSIPVLDEDRISFFDRKNTIFMTNTESVVQGGLLEVRLQYRFKNIYNETNINSLSLNVTIPNELAFIDNSVMVDGVKANYSVNRNQEEITVPVKKVSGTLKFYVRPMESKDVQLRAMANFSYQNRNISEVLGTSNVNVNYVTINGPKETNSKEITVTGIAPPNTKLSIYDEKTKIGETIVPASGKWSKQLTLANAYLGTVHLLSAKTTDQTPEKQSNQIEVTYLYKAPALKSATLVHNGASKDISNAFLKGEKPVVTINPSKPFTFKIVMLNGEAIDKMYISSSRNQEKKLLEAIYDKATGSWIASGYFDPSNLGYVPGALNIEYTTKKETVDLNGAIDFTKEEYVNALPDPFKNAKVEVIEQTDTVSRTVIELADSEKTKLETVNTQTVIPSNVTRTTLMNEGYTKIDDDTFASFKVSNDKIITKVYDFNENLEKEMYIQLADQFSLTKPIAAYFGIKENVVNIGGSIVHTALLENKILNSNLTAAEKKEQLTQLGVLATMNVAYNSFRMASTVIELAGLAGPPGLAVTIAWFAADQLMEYFYLNSMKSLEENGSMFAWLIDPSGFVYEALPENRLKGVKVTVFYKDPKTGEVLKWNAEEFEQMNPLITNDNGEYAWDVPEGLWQVKYELEGYETTFSEWLPVPPPQTTVNIGMVSKKKPEVKVLNIFKDKAEFVFDKYMEVDSVNLSSIGLKDSKGKNIIQTVEALDAKKSDSGKMLAKKFIIHFLANTTFAVNSEYQLEVKNSVKTYAQVSPDNMIVVKTKYTALPQNIIAQDNVDITYGQTTRIPIHVSDVTNASGLKIQVESNMKELVEPVESTVELDSKGESFVSVKGNLPGQATLLLTIVGTDVTKEINVNVLSVGTMAPNQKPTISASDIIINAGDRPDWLKGVTAYDQEDGNLTSKIKITQNTVNTAKPGIYKISYSVSDSNGLTDTKEIKVTVKELPNHKPTITATDLTIFVGDKPNWLKNVTAYDQEDGSLTSKIKITQNTVNTSKPGVYKIIYSVSDKKGLTATKEIKVTVKKIIYPKLIVIPLDDNDRILTGQTDIGVKLSAQIGKKTFFATIDKAGKFKIVNIPLQKANTVVVITAVDKFNHKTTKTIKVLDKTPPKLPTLNRVSTKTTSLKGKTEAYGKVYLTIGKQKSKLTANSKGEYSKKISKLKKGTMIRIYVVDRAGNKSKELLVKVK
ncbi:immunoglobulin-like domain-containing protein [Neobacillus drentensis]|uniref:immunoglobulin-like domain-containing protein n=1 Tax=Neobacillus drentensis TaxID=220684 RepID=UPI00300389E9